MHPWCTPGHGGLVPEDRELVLIFPWNDSEAFEELVTEHPDEIAALILTPFHHPAFGNSILPAPGFLKKLETICRRRGIVLVLDDVRAGFRLHLGGSHRLFGFEPDLICFSKAIANGYALSATLGREELKRAAGKVFLTGSFWNGAASMMAALACLAILEREKVVDRLATMGSMLVNGLVAGAKKHGLEVICSGPPAMPFLTFADETNFFRSQCFSAAAAERGVFFHPHHNWFLSAAHRPRDIEEALIAADYGFERVAEQFGDGKKG